MSIRSHKAHANILISEEKAFDWLFFASILIREIDTIVTVNNLLQNWLSLIS